MRKFSIIVLLLALLWSPVAVRATGMSLSERLKGYILLQVQSHGEAWYVNPQDGKRYYMTNGEVAYQMMRKFGLGITNTDLSKLLAGNGTLLSRLKGKIVLKVQAHGEAYYVCPRDLSVRYMKDGAAAYQIMRQCNLGITNANLDSIPVGSLDASQALIPPITTPYVPGPIPSPTITVAPVVAGCQVFPTDNAWNKDISTASVHPKSATYMTSIGTSKKLHPDFGYASYGNYGIPINIISGSQTRVPITFTAYGNESDPGPYPVPANARVEDGSDRHVLVLDKDACMLYELFNASKNGSGWNADAGAVWDLKSNKLRPHGWTSADAAGLPIMPGLVRYEEVASGEIKHAIRFTAHPTQNGYILPATHHAGTNNDSLPPMGLRVRLKADYDISKLTGQAKVIATAMKKYGMILADNGGDWYITGENDPRWNDSELNQLKQIPASAFEAVYTGEIIK